LPTGCAPLRWRADSSRFARMPTSVKPPANAVHPASRKAETARLAATNQRANQWRKPATDRRRA
jgi:hypothetical protein